MSFQNVPIFPASPLCNITQFTSSTSTSTPTSILPTQTNGAKVESIMVSSTNGSAIDLKLFLNTSSTNYQIGQISIPANAGSSDTIPAVNLLSATTSGSYLLPLPLDANGNPYLYVTSSVSITAEPNSALTSSDVWNIVVTGGAF